MAFGLSLIWFVGVDRGFLFFLSLLKSGVGWVLGDKIISYTHLVFLFGIITCCGLCGRNTYHTFPTNVYNSITYGQPHNISARELDTLFDIYLLEGSVLFIFQFSCKVP